ncbi:glycosyltransferase family 4 protein [Coleofasciculus sp.]|uniref:glycosyltransferase family 4 protein n=1 Tax=Coleofasciculus sp. TaxID=3100458 RepID=UPI003A359D84
MPLRKQLKQPSILSIGIIRQGSSYGRLFEALYSQLLDTYDIHHIGIDYQGEKQDRGWMLYPNPIRTDIRGCETLRSLLRTIEPDIVFILNDLWKVYDPLAVLDESETNAKIVVCCPVDGAIVDTNLVNFLSRVDRLVVFTKLSKATVCEAINASFGEEALHLVDKVAVIANGVDRTQFYPIAGELPCQESRHNRISARQKLFPNQPELQDSFIVLNANMNQPRKRLDVTLEGFAQFARDKEPSVRLLLHSKWHEPECDLMELAQQFGIKDRLLKVTDPTQYPSVSDETLNLIYNACEVGLNTSMGEGWGLVSFEHAATGAAQVLPRHRCGQELWDGCAELIELAQTIARSEFFLEIQLIKADDVAQALERLYQSPEHLAAVSKACYENATRVEYSWEAIASQWHELFQSVLAEGCTEII